jgi:hypothetical protein
LWTKPQKPQQSLDPNSSYFLGYFLEIFLGENGESGGQIRGNLELSYHMMKAKPQFCGPISQIDQDHEGVRDENKEQTRT